MSNENIPAGYQLHVTTWENDADNYSTQIINGLTEEDVHFLLSLARNFKSRNDTKPGLGNDEVDTDVLTSLIRDALEANPDISSAVRADWIEGIASGDIAYELFIDRLLGSPGEGYGGYFCRVFDDYEVFYFKTEVKNVSDKFS